MVKELEALMAAALPEAAPNPPPPWETGYLRERDVAAGMRAPAAEPFVASMQATEFQAPRRWPILRENALTGYSPHQWGRKR